MKIMKKNVNTNGFIHLQPSSSLTFDSIFNRHLLSLPPKPTLDPLCTVKVYPKSNTGDEPAHASSETTKQLIKTFVDLKGTNIGIKTMKSINRNGVSIMCRNQDEAKDLAEAIRAKASTNLDIKTPQKRNPSLSMLLQGVGYSLQDLKEDILKKNDLPGEAESINLVGLTKTDGGNTIIVMVVSPSTYKALAANNFRCMLDGHE